MAPDALIPHATSLVLTLEGPMVLEYGIGIRHMVLEYFFTFVCVTVPEGFKVTVQLICMKNILDDISDDFSQLSFSTIGCITVLNKQSYLLCLFECILYLRTMNL